MAEDYQTRKDIEYLYRTVWDTDTNQLNLVQKSELQRLLDKLGFSQDESTKFNFAVISRDNGNIEYWILANSYYDYDAKRFVKIDTDYTSHAIQIQAKGTYAGEEELDANNTSIGVWRNPRLKDVYMDIEHYDYTDFIEKSYIGAKQIGGDWVEYGISSGWNNTLMLDAYGGMTVGGAGFEVDGNGIFPYTRLTSSSYMSNGSQFYLLGLLDNAYHPTTGGWECDDNSNWAWFVGMKFPHKSETYMHKDTENASFVVMYNDMASIDTTADDYTIHQMSSSDWHIVFEVDKNGAKGGGGGGGSTDVYPSDNTPLTDLSGGSAGTSELYSRADHRHPLLNAYPPETHTHDDLYYQKTYIDNNMPSISEIPKKSSSAPPMDTTNGDIGTDNGKYARENHSHPKSNLYATSGHQHDYSNTYASKSHAHNELESDGVMRKNNVAQTSKNVITDTNGKITTENKPVIPVGADSMDVGDETQPDYINSGVGSSEHYARADHVHPLSYMYATSTHDHDSRYSIKTHAHGELQSDGVMRKNTVAQTSKNVVTNSNGEITTENKPAVSQWVEVSSNIAGATFYVNETLRLVDFSYYRTSVSFTSGYNDMGTVPSAYKPVSHVTLSFRYTDQSGYIDAEDSKFYINNSGAGTRNAGTSAMWHY